MRNLRIPILAVVAALLLGLAFIFLLYQPRSDEQAALEAERDQLQSQQAGVQAEIAELERIRSQEPQFREILARLDQLIPTDVAQPKALADFQATADTAGVEIRSVNFSDPVPAQPPVVAPTGQQLAVITTTMVLEGGYFEAVDFLRRLELEGPRAVLTQTVSVVEGQEQFPSLSTTWTGQLFALLPPEDFAAGATVPAPVAGAGDGASASPAPGAAASPAAGAANTPPPQPSTGTS